MNRRGFIRLFAAMGVAAASGNLLNQSLALRSLGPTSTVTLTRPMMGTSVSISVLDVNNFRATEAAEAALAEMEQLEKILSRYRPDSPVYRLNQDGHLVRAPMELLKVLDRARFFSELSEGAFDVTVQPIVDLISRSFAASGQPPSESELANILRDVDYHDIELAGSTIGLRHGSGVTLDGIAKGYIVDRAIEVLKGQGCQNALVAASGDIRTLGDKENGKGWRVGIQDPLRPDNLIRIMNVADRAVATSGDYEIFFDANKQYFHIVNPKTGHSPQEIHSATIVANNAMDADAIGTTVMVLGARQGLELVERIEGAECFLVLRDSSTAESSGMKNFWAR